MEFYSANEYWVKAGSLFHTDPHGHGGPARPSGGARLYLLSSKQHGGAGNPASKGMLPALPESARFGGGAARALRRDWTNGRRRAPRRRRRRFRSSSNGTMVPPLPQIAVGLPEHIPGVTYTGLKTTRYRFNSGRTSTRTGIPTINPPVITPPYQDNPANGPIYPELRSEDRQRRQRDRGHPPARTDGPARDLHRMGPAIRRLGERRMRRLRAIHPVPAHQGRAHCRGRSAAIGRRALQVVRSVSQRGRECRRRHGQEPPDDLRRRDRRGEAPDRRRNHRRRSGTARARAHVPERSALQLASGRNPDCRCNPPPQFGGGFFMPDLRRAADRRAAPRLSFVRR